MQIESVGWHREGHWSLFSSNPPFTFNHSNIMHVFEWVWIGECLCMWICVCVCACDCFRVCTVYLCASLPMGVCLCTSMRANVKACVCVGEWFRCAFVSMCTFVCCCAFPCMHLRVCVSVCVCVSWRKERPRLSKSVSRLIKMKHFVVYRKKIQTLGH